MEQFEIPSSVRFRVHLYGLLEVYERDECEGWTIIPRERWGMSQQARTVFRRLLTAQGRWLSTGQLIDDLFGEEERDEEVVLDALRRIIRVVRQVVGKDRLTIWEGAYQLADQSSIWVDAEACAGMMKQAENMADRVASIPLLETALSLMERGAYLAQEGGLWSHAARAPHETMLTHCRLMLAESYESQGKYLQASLSYQALQQISWLDEETQRHAEERKALVEAQMRTPRVVVSSPFQPLEIIAFQDEGGPEYASLGTDILALVWRWHSSISVATLQQLCNEVIRKHDTTMHQSDETKISRRHALQAVAMFPLQVYGMKLLSVETFLPPPEEALPMCAASLVACWELRQHEAEGMAAIQRALALCLPTLERIAKQSSPAQQVAAARLAAQGYLLVSLLTSRQGKLEQMETASRMARFYAQIAQDPNLEVSALARLAVKFDYENCYAKMLKTYQEAVALPGFSLVTPLLQSRTYAGLAGVYADCQQAPKALSYLGQAKELYPAAPEADPSFAFAFHSKSGLAVWEGMTLERTHHYTEAIAAFSQFGSLTPLAHTSETNRAEHLRGVASVAVRQRDLEQAVLYLDTSLEVAWSIHHAQREKEVRETLHDMQLLWPDEPKVKALQEKILSR